MLKLNTHHYDGLLDQVKKELLSDLTRISNLPAKDKIINLHTLSTTLSLRKTSSPQSRNNISRIIGDYVNVLKGTSPMMTLSTRDNNFESTNGFHSEDLLYYLYEATIQLELEDRNNLLDLINHQLKEMSSGFCPQGRAYRLLQGVQIARDLLTLKSNKKI